MGFKIKKRMFRRILETVTEKSASIVDQLEMDYQECIVIENNFDHDSRSKGYDKAYFSIQYFQKHAYSHWL